MLDKAKHKDNVKHDVMLNVMTLNSHWGRLSSTSDGGRSWRGWDDLSPRPRHSIEAFDQRGDSHAQDHFNSGSW